MKTENNLQASIGTLGIWSVFGLLLYLKLTEQTDMSWLWVFSPFWLPISLVIGILGLVGLLAFVIKVIKR